MSFFKSIWAFILKVTDPLQKLWENIVHPWFQGDVSDERQSRLSASLSFLFLLFNLVGIFATLNNTESITLYSLAALTVLIIFAYVLSRTQRYKIGALVLVISLSLFSYLPILIRPDLSGGEVSASIYSFLPVAMVLASSILGAWTMFLGSVVNMLIISAIPSFIPAYSFTQAGTDGGNILTLGFLLLVVVSYRNSTERHRLAEFQKTNEALKNANAELSQVSSFLEIRVQERTAELEHQSEQLTRQSEELLRRSEDLEKANFQMSRRASQLQLVSEVARTIASLQDINKLLPEITSLLSDRFGFYHTGIFLLDDNEEYAVLSAANSEGGQRMLARNHRLKVGEVGIVGYTTGRAEPRIAHDTGEDAFHFKNPDLPETRSEMAIPLMASGRVIGALDVQSKEVNAFSEEDLSVMKTLADQISIAIQNARAFEETRRALAEADALYRQNLRKDWGRLTRDKRLVGFRYAGTGSIQLTELVERPEIRQAVSTGKEVANEKVQDIATNALAVPLKLRGEVIGVLNIRAPENQRWTQDDVDLARAVAERVSISAENARLFEETSGRAERERTVADITNKIRSTNDPNVMLATAMEELKKALGASRVQIIPYQVQQAQAASSEVVQQSKKGKKAKPAS